MKQTLLRYDPVRAVVATVALALAGAIFGGLAGAIALAIVMALTGASFGLVALGIAGQIGAVLGVISLPLVVWVMLRRVPLGRAFAWLTFSTMLGGIVGWFAFSSIDIIFGPMLAAFAAFITSAVVLSIRYERASALTPARCARLDPG